MSDLIEFKKILSDKNIQILGEVNFSSENLKIDFLNKLELFYKNDIKLEFINQDIINIFLELDFTEDTISKLRKINWDDFNNLFKTHDKNKREEKIYQNFITFLRAELGLLREELPLNQKILLNDKEEYNTNFHLDLYKPQSDFNIEEDLKEKAKKFGIEILFDYTEDPHKLTVNDFTLYFNKRLQYFTQLLKNRVNIDNIMRISSLKDLYSTNSEVSVIGLVNEITTTNKGHYMISIEDKSGVIKCFINKDKTDLVAIVETLCLDEGIAISGKIGENIIWTDEIIIPSPPNATDLKRTENEEFILFFSDLHFGAKVFVDEAFQKMIDWLNGESSNEKLNKTAKKIKHIVIPGDIIEGIGIYPGQGKDARILSSELQYHEAARWLSQIPKHISIIIIPGNHDIVRLSEPQPKLPYDKTYALYNMENVIMLSNPSRVILFPNDPSGGVEVYLYHGGSLFYYADKIKYLREIGGAKKPEEVVKYLLEKRHLAPSHGATLYIPDTQNDPLVIKKMPDFFAVGHTHKLSLANYKGCTIISCGCWVEMSDYQEKMGMYPDVGKCILINTKTRKPQIINFYIEKHKRIEVEE